MNIITLWQPWATLIQLKIKTTETSMHNYFSKLKGQIIGIHAGGKWDDEWEELAGPYMNAVEIDTIQRMHSKGRIPFKNIIAVAFVDDTYPLNSVHSKKALIDCSAGDRYGLILTNVRALDPFIRVSGQQGIWKYEI